MPTWLSNGPAPTARTVNGATAPAAIGDRALSERAMTAQPRLASPAEGLHDPAVVAAQVEGDDDVARLEQGDVAHHDDLVAVEQRDAAAEAGQLPGELGGDPTGCLPRQHPHLAAVVGQQVDRRPERGRVDALQRLVHVVELDRQAAPEQVGGRRLPDALGRRAQLAPQLPLHRFLQAGEAVVAELGRQAHHRGGTRSGLARQVGDRSEGDELRVLEHDVGHPPLGRREPLAGVGDRPCHVHGAGC